MSFVEKVRERLNTLNVQESLRVAAIDIVPVMQQRIFEDGKTPEGNDIGKYSTRPLTIEKKDMAQTGGGVPSGNDSKFFEGGYKQYKESLGRGENFDLRNFGIMMRDFLTPKETVSGLSIKYTFKQQRNVDIAAKYPQAFGLSKSERDIFQKTFSFELAKRLFKP